MKKIIVPICVTISLMTQSFASGTSTLLEQVRAEKVELFKNNLDAIVNRVNSYILNSGDIDITRKKVQEFDGLPYQFFNNFQNVSCTNDGKFCGGQTGTDGIQVSLTEKSIVLKNTLGANPNSYVKKAFTTNNDNSRAISTADNYTVTFPLDSKTKNFIASIDKIKDNSDIHIGSEPPSDTSKIWYFPNGNGGFDIKKWNSTTNKWENIGSTSNNGETSIHASSEEELLEIPCVKNDKAFVINKATATEYLCSQDGEWAMVLGGSSAFNGASDMLNLVTKLMKKTGGSVADVSDPNIASAKQAFAGNQSFTKKDNTANNGYWTATDKTTGVEYIATDTYETLKTINSIDGSYAFLPNMKKDGVDTLIRYQNRWLYLANGYMEIVSYFTFVPEDGFATIKNVGTGYKIDGEGQFFKRVGNYFVSQSNVLTEDYKVMMTLKDRNAFDSSLGHQVYLVANNDCTVDSCNGVGGTYAGAKIEDMYAFYYTTGGKHKKNLTDATPHTSWNTFWDNEISAVQWNGSTFGIVPTGGILIKNSINGQTTYSYNGKYINKSQGLEIPYNKLPSGLYATTATITQNAGFNYVNVSSLDTFVIDSNLDLNYTVNLTGSGFTNKLLTRCDNRVWSDNCLSIGTSTLAVTDGSRSDLPSPSNKTRVNLTKDIGTEPKYTTSGVTYTADAGYKQWFYSNSGTNTNYMLDAYPFTEDAYEGEGTSLIAKSIGYGIKNNIVAKFESNLWRRLDNGDVLSSSFTASRAFESWMETYANDLGGMANNGLIYTGSSYPFDYTYRLDDQFGVTTHWNQNNAINPRMNNTNICAIRGMRLPLLSETNGTSSHWGNYSNFPSGSSIGNSNGVPSHPMGNTWTSTANTVSTIDYWMWYSSFASNNGYSNKNYVRCVR